MTRFQICAATATLAVALHGSCHAQNAGASQTCVQVAIAGQKAPGLSCLNQELQQLSAAASPQNAPLIPLSAGSGSNAVGTFSRAGVAEQYGQNFGKSVIPYRPPAPVFNNIFNNTVH